MGGGGATFVTSPGVLRHEPPLLRWWFDAVRDLQAGLQPSARREASRRGAPWYRIETWASSIGFPPR